MINNNKIINLGILAHVDAGKTSLSELFLHKSGLIRELGSVDKGSSQTDWLEVEKERGISVRCASASFEWNDHKINIIDTPGHIDFSSEVERTLRAMDSAILVLSAVEGIQAHSETLWEALQELKIPTLIFINKIDRAGSNTLDLIQDIKYSFSTDLVELQKVIGEGDERVKLENIIREEQEIDNELFIESIINNDDKLMENYLNGVNLHKIELLDSLIQQFHKCKLTPIFYGSVKYDIGINELLEGITKLMPTTNGDDSKPLSGIVFKVEHDKAIGKVASVRLFNGSIHNRDKIKIYDTNKEEKISQIRRLQGENFIDIGELHAGDTAAICGVQSLRAGDIIGNPEGINKAIKLNTALLTVKVFCEKSEEYSGLVRAMHILSDEDPSIELLWLKDERELHIKIMGLIQLEILKTILLNRFNLVVGFDKPTVIYKETVSTNGIGHEEYTMPKPCWAVVSFKIEAAERGSGLEYSSEVGVNHIAHRYQQEIERSLPIALKQGILGWEVTDLKITLVGGEHHNVHSRAGDFAVATAMAIMKGLKEMGTKLLEPMLDFKISAPESTLGKITSSLTTLRSEFGTAEIKDNKFTLTGHMPLSSSLEYSTLLGSITGGKAKFKTKFSGYKECPLEYGAKTEFRGVNPLDRAKYILKARKALQ